MTAIVLLPTSPAQRMGAILDRWRKKYRNNVLFILCGIGLSLFAPLVGALSPSLNWDSIAYVAIVKSWSHPAPADYHAEAYADVRRFADAVRPGGYDSLVSSSEYRRVVATEPAAFSEQLPFYRIRPLYIAIIKAVSLITPTVAAATAAISVLAVLATNLLILTVAVRHLGALAGCGALAVVALSPLMIDLVQKSTPDALYVLFVTAGVTLLARHKDLAGLLVLVAATAVRSDAMLMTLMIAFALTAERVWIRRSGHIWTPAAFMLGSLALGQIIAHVAGGYPFRVLYSVSFVAFVPHPADLVGIPIPFSVVLSAWTRGIPEALANGGLWIILTQAVVILFVFGSKLAEPPWRLIGLMTAMIAYTVMRLIVFPEHDLRLNAPVFTGMSILLISAVERLKHAVPAQKVSL